MKWYDRKKDLYQDKLIENIDYVICQICKERFSQLGTHFKKSHKDITKKQYLILYPESKLCCEVFLTKSLGSRQKKKKYTVEREGNTEGEDYVICRICDNTFKNLNNHTLIHGLTIEEYKNQFPGALLICNKERKEISKKLKGVSIEERVGKERADIISQQISDDHKTRRERGVYTQIKESLIEGHLDGTILPSNTGHHCIRIEGKPLLQKEVSFRSVTEYLYNEILLKQSKEGKDFIYFYEGYTFDLYECNTLTLDFILVFDWDIDRIQNTFHTLILNREQIKFVIESSMDWKVEEVKGYVGETPFWNKKKEAFKRYYPDINMEVIQHNFVLSRLSKYNLPSYKEILLQYGDSKDALRYQTKHSSSPETICNS